MSVRGGKLLAFGREADVFDIGDGRVLRRYRDGSSAVAEAEFMAFVATHGFPVPIVYDVDGSDLVMERLDGPTLAMAMPAGTLDVPAGAQVLADLHNRLHELAAPTGGPMDRAVHLDLHPENVMVTSRGPVVIDWHNASEGSPDLDVAMAALILAQVAVDDTDARAPLVRAFLDDFLRQVHGDATRLLDEAVTRRRADPHATSTEHEQLPLAISLVHASS